MHCNHEKQILETIDDLQSCFRDPLLRFAPVLAAVGGHRQDPAWMLREPLFALTFGRIEDGVYRSVAGDEDGRRIFAFSQ